ncbi:hypothetical protein CDL12_14926 [Handroanthus impetiginosus]|uniref:Uncharacterized protein n=1 Tax=Handroanthus impetiginosus TaxID=429701 RepID=A0A2G9H4N3_9LAMI|nr:hypothetical protein CDL12_14926 [Handroanthus impetiginosus]
MINRTCPNCITTEISNSKWEISGSILLGKTRVLRSNRMPRTIVMLPLEFLVCKWKRTNQWRNINKKDQFREREKTNIINNELYITLNIKL